MVLCIDKRTDQSRAVVGQSPSLADIANDEARIFDPLLDRADRAELHRAIGLYAHGIGIGSFAYLRRVFERLIDRTFRQHQAAEHCDESDWQRRRVKERISLLKNFLPDFLHECEPLYGVLSKRLHELDEDEYKVCFPVLKAAILEILDDEKRAREKEKLRNQTQSQLSALATKIGNRNGGE